MTQLPAGTVTARSHADDATTETTESAARHPRRPLLHRVVLAQTAVIMLLVVIALPIAFHSMGGELLAQQQHRLYAFPSGVPVAESVIDDEAVPHSYFNIAAVDLDEAAGSLTLAISGHRNCPDTCPTLTLKLVSLNEGAHERRALPPSAEITLTPDQDIFTETVTLPLQGHPSLYPFDVYTLWLGLAGSVEVNGQEVPLSQELAREHAIITTQNQVRENTLSPPVAIDPKRVQGLTDPFAFFGVQELRFDRPVHMEILTALLITLMAISAILAVAMREIRDLIFGVGSLILAVWGIRSVLIPVSLPVTTSVDMALSVIILVVLLSLIVRAAWHFAGEGDVVGMLRRWREGRQ
jgi:hypothetical protein